MTTLASPPLRPTRFLLLCRALLLLLGCSLFSTPAFADDRAALRVLTQDFYKAYLAAGDPGKFIAKSDKITPAFKKAYAAFMKKGADYDPIVQGQDVPSSGYQAKEVELDEKKATVTLTARDKGFTTLKVHLVWDGQHWLLNGVNGLSGK